MARFRWSYIPSESGCFLSYGERVIAILRRVAPNEETLPAENP